MVEDEFGRVARQEVKREEDSEADFRSMARPLDDPKHDFRT